MANMFSVARTSDAKEPVKAKKSNKKEVQITGLKMLASLSALMKSMQALYETTEADVKAQMAEYFVSTGEKEGRVPENFRGVEENASASCEIRKRSTRSVLSDEEVQLLNDNGVSFETVVDVPECFIINPEITNDAVLLERVSKALEKVPGLPADFIQFQPAKLRRVATEDSMKQIFEKRIATDLLGVVSTLAIKPTLQDAHVLDMMDALKVKLQEQVEANEASA